MYYYWWTELRRIAFAVLLVGLIGVTTKNWILAAILPVFSYIAWHLYQMYQLEQWLREPTRLDPPAADGIWSLVVRHIYKRHTANRRQKKRLQDLLSRFNSVVSALPNAAVVLNADKEIEWSNKVARKLLGVERNRDAGKHIGNLIRDPQFVQFMRDETFTEELELPSPIQSDKIISIQVKPFAKRQYLLTARDVSQRVYLQQVRKTFIANASHELRTPLTVISGYLEILEAAEDIPEEHRRGISSALVQAHRMQGIVADMLTLSRLESATLVPIERDSIDVCAVVSRIVSDIQQSLLAPTHELVVDLESGLSLGGDEAELASVFQNLIENAVKHTELGTRIEIGWHRTESGGACFRVRDNGEGIPSNCIPRLTERFYRVDESRSRRKGGTGLGLSIVKYIVERHEGTLNISSQIGEGSEFSVFFPPERVLSSACENID